MGGSVSVVLREPNGTVYRMNRWTNILPGTLTDPRLYSKDAEETAAWLREFMHSYELMKADYEKHSADGQYELNMTEAYFPWDSAVPLEYGMVFIDLLDRRIASMQDYCIEPAAMLVLSPASQDNMRQNLIGLIKADVVQQFRVNRESFAFGDRPVEQILDQLFASREILQSSAYFPLTPRDFDVESVAMTADGALLMYSMLDKAGIIDRERDNREWVKWLDYKCGEGAWVERLEAVQRQSSKPRT